MASSMYRSAFRKMMTTETRGSSFHRHGSRSDVAGALLERACEDTQLNHVARPGVESARMEVREAEGDRTMIMARPRAASAANRSRPRGIRQAVVAALGQPGLQACNLSDGIGIDFKPHPSR